MKSSFLLIFCFVFILPIAVAQPQPSPPSPPTLLETLRPTFVPFVNPSGRALFPLSTRAFQTTLYVRFFLLFSVADYESNGACHPKALSFLGVRIPISPSLCTPLARITLLHYVFYGLNQVNFPTEAAIHLQFLTSIGLAPDTSSTDRNTESGWANMVVERINDYFANDGWNALGDRNSEVVRRPYSDYSSYTPVNPPGRLASKLRKPLRWQPLEEPTVNSPGEYIFQQHITPFLGNITPLVLTKAQVRAMETKSVYKNPEMKNSVSIKDRNKLEKLIENYFRISRELTPQQRFLAFFWDFKAISLSGFLGLYTTVFRFDDFTRTGFTLGEALALHDSVVMAWHQKRIHDLVRPTTIIRKLWAGRTVRAYVGFDGGVKDMKVEEYEPLVLTQPHSEFPSASAVMCQVVLDYVGQVVRDQVGENVTLPTFSIPARLAPLVPVVGDFFVNFKTIPDAIRSCSNSRLWAGVHFPPAVREGRKLGQGVGNMIFDHVSDLMNGRVPRNCARCP